METAFPYLIGAIAISIPWLAFSIWQQYSFSCKTLVEKELSFRVGFAHARNLMSGKPMAGENVHRELQPPTMSENTTESYGG